MIGWMPIIAAGLGGCAIDYVDAKGDRHIVGFAAVTIPAKVEVPDIRGACARAGRVTAVGLYLFANELGGGAVLGTTRQSSISLESCDDIGGGDERSMPGAGSIAR